MTSPSNDPTNIPVPEKKPDDFTHVSLVCPFGIKASTFFGWQVNAIFRKPEDSVKRLLASGNWSCVSRDNGNQVTLRPRKIYLDQEGRQGHILVLCDDLLNNGEAAAAILNHPEVTFENPRFRMQQDLVFFAGDGGSCYGAWGPHPWAFENAIPDRAVVDSVIQEVFESCGRAGIPLGVSESTDSLPHQRVKIAHYSLQSGTSIADDVWVLRYIGKRVAKKYGLVMMDPNLIPGYYVDAAIRMEFSTRSMRNARAYEPAIVAADKLEMKHSLLGEHHNKFKIIRRTDASEYAIEIEMLPSEEMMDPYKITSRMAEAVLLWTPTILEILIAKSYTIPLLCAVRLTCNKFRRSSS